MCLPCMHEQLLSYVYVCCPSCTTASTLHAPPSWQTASCLCMHVFQLSNSFPNTCTYIYTSAVQQLSYHMCIQLATSSMLVRACTPAVQQLPCYIYFPAGKQLHVCMYVETVCVCESLCVYVCACLTMPSTYAPKHKMHVSTYLLPSDFVKKPWRTYHRNAPKVVTDNGLIIFNNF